MAIYAGMLEYMDMSIGRVLEHLKEKGVLDNTIVVFLSYNGGKARELMDHFPEYNAKNFNTNYENMGDKGTFVEYGRITPYARIWISASCPHVGIREFQVAEIPSGTRSLRSERF